MIGRILFYRGFIVLAVSFWLISLFRIQITQGEQWRDRSDRNRIRAVRVESTRGQIYDRNGILLATNRPSLDIYVTPEDYNVAESDALGKIIGVDSNLIISRVEHPKDAAFIAVLVKRDVSRETVFKLEERKPQFAGVSVQVSGIRTYPEAKNSAHVLGYLGKITGQEYQSQKDKIHHFSDWIGRSGVERHYDSQLSGREGGRQVEVNVRGRPLRVLTEKEPEAGQDLHLSIDVRLQGKIIEAFEGRKGAAVIADLETGEIVSLVSQPDFDPNVFVTSAGGSERLELLNDRENLPLLNRASNAAFAPGSVFKIVTALAALEDRKIHPSTKVHCPGHYQLSPNSRVFKCWNPSGHGDVNLGEAVERSCNVYFYKLGGLVGANKIAKMARELGLGEIMDFDLSEITAGLVPDEVWKKERYHERWYAGETANMAIGQGYLLTTPMQLTRLMGILGKKKMIPEFHLNQDQVEPEGKLWAAKEKKLNLREANLDIVREAMLRVVQSGSGTAHLADVPYLLLAGKTGTSQNSSGRSHAWFSGFFPFENPKYAMTVFLENGGSGGYQGAQLARRMLMAMNDLHLITHAF